MLGDGCGHLFLETDTSADCRPRFDMGRLVPGSSSQPTEAKQAKQAMLLPQRGRRAQVFELRFPPG